MYVIFQNWIYGYKCDADYFMNFSLPSISGVLKTKERKRTKMKEIKNCLDLRMFN